MQDTPKKILRLLAVLDKTSLSRSTIERLTRRTIFPKPIKLADNAVGWFEHEVDAWLTERAAVSRFEA
jgi:prophage regulatory protein